MLYMPMLPLPLSGPRRLNFTVREITGWYDRRRFVRFAANVYRGDRYWAPGVISERMCALDPKKNPALAHIQLGLFIAESRTLDEIVGTIGVWTGSRDDTIGPAPRTAFFGLFEAINEGEVVSSLLETAATWVLEHLPGAVALRGPMELDPCRSPGLLVDGYDHRPAVLMPYNPPYYPELIETAGYEPSIDLLAYQLDLSALRGAHRAGAIPLQTGVQNVQPGRDLVIWEVSDQPGWRRILREVVLRSPDLTWRFGAASPGVTSAELVWRLERIAASRPPTTLLVVRTSEGGDAVAFGVAAPNTGESALARLEKRAAGRWWGRSMAGRRTASRAARRAGIRLLPAIIRTDCQGWSLEGLILSELLNRTTRQGHALAEVSPVPAGNPVATDGLAALGASPYKTYRIYEKRL